MHLCEQGIILDKLSKISSRSEVSTRAIQILLLSSQKNIVPARWQIQRCGRFTMLVLRPVFEYNNVQHGPLIYLYVAVDPRWFSSLERLGKHVLAGTDSERADTISDIPPTQHQDFQQHRVDCRFPRWEAHRLRVIRQDDSSVGCNDTRNPWRGTRTGSALSHTFPMGSTSSPGHPTARLVNGLVIMSWTRTI